jgi:DnaJ family protein C protein 3
MGRNAAALEDLDLILQQKPDFDQALLQRAKLHLRECSIPLARMDVEQLIGRQQQRDGEQIKQLQAEVDEIEALMKEIKANANQQASGEQLLPKMQRAIEVCPQDAEIRRLRAEVYERQGSYEMAAHDYS